MNQKIKIIFQLETFLENLPFIPESFFKPDIIIYKSGDQLSMVLCVLWNVPSQTLHFEVLFDSVA
jgi:hypothetical protein